MSETEPKGQESQDSQPMQPHSPPFRFIPRTPQEIAIAICGIGIIAAFFAPWTRHGDRVSGAELYHLEPLAELVWIIPALALATIIMMRDRGARRRLGTATALLTWFALGYAGVIVHRPGDFAWGGRLSIWFALGLFAFSGDNQVSTSLAFVARKLGSRKAAVFSHWGTLVADCHFSTKDCYAALERAIRAKEWPGADLIRISYAEVGLLSHKREYLRVIRKRQVFDICAATFGTDYFFSVREAEIPAVVTFRAFLALMLALLYLFALCVQTLGLIFGSCALALLVAFMVWFLFSVLKLGLARVDAMLLQLPAVGAVYEAWFRRETYFEQDSRLAFLQSVSELVKQHVEDTTSAKGIKFLNSFERQPILDELYKRSRIELKAQAA